ncbi:MAG: glycosyltransferase [Phocaeicola sp.]|uniref:glycosyltransferase n=1 Tax=Phocaeicola TaxID=909656 RepID=UPI00234E6618|nr:glycosyltransferase [Phocaeicola oris]MCE2617194.1 glycosyltransferase [Phocaeicola oris]
MKKRIFIAIHYLEIGGAEISLIGLLQAIDYSKYDVDLFLYSHRGELMQYVPKEVHLLPEIQAYAYIEQPMKETLLAGQFGIVYGRLKAQIQFKKYQIAKNPSDASSFFSYIFNNVEPYLPSLKMFGQYDLAISFLTPHNIVLHKVDAKKKVAWIHTDYSQIDVNIDLELPIWTGYDHIVSISPDVTRNFLKVFPILKGKIVEIKNILSSEFVRTRASESGGMSLEFRAQSVANKKNHINLLSVGRFCEAKNYDNIPNICRHLRDKGLDVNWYLIGYGGDETLIRQKIVEEGMKDYVIILGKKENPYPYIRACDIYVQPSRYEGNSVTVREAQILCKPVVVTNYATAASQINDGLDGIIVPHDNTQCAEGIYNFIQNKSLQEKIIDYLKSHNYGNMREVEKVYRLIT